MKISTILSQLEEGYGGKYGKSQKAAKPPVMATPEIVERIAKAMEIVAGRIKSDYDYVKLSPTGSSPIRLSFGKSDKEHHAVVVSYYGGDFGVQGINVRDGEKRGGPGPLYIENVGHDRVMKMDDNDFADLIWRNVPDQYK